MFLKLMLSSYVFGRKIIKGSFLFEKKLITFFGRFVLNSK